MGDIWLEPAYFFSITWALAILGVGFWAWKANRVWLINVWEFFGSIHFYTQWFETLGAQPKVFSWVVSLLWGLLSYLKDLIIILNWNPKIINYSNKNIDVTT